MGRRRRRARAVGKLNLTIIDADDAHVATTYRRKVDGTGDYAATDAAFAARFQGCPREHLGVAGREVIALADERSSRSFRRVKPRILDALVSLPICGHFPARDTLPTAPT